MQKDYVILILLPKKKNILFEGLTDIKPPKIELPKIGHIDKIIWVKFEKSGRMFLKALKQKFTQEQKESVNIHVAQLV